MDRSFSECPSRWAFTLIELLVVISIIAVLAGLLLPVGNKVLTNSRKVQTKNTELQLVNAINAFKAEYGSYPLPVNTPSQFTTGQDDVCFGVNSPTLADLCDILQANNQGQEAVVNTRGIVYIELPKAKNPKAGQAKGGLGSDRMLYDPWGKPFLVGVDTNYDGTVPNPYSQTGSQSGPNVLRTSVIAYSWGPDAATTSNFNGGGGDKNTGTSADDVVSWQ